MEENNVVTTTTETTEETTEESTEPTNFIPDISFTTYYEEITLDGDPDSVFVSTDYCYLESDKYFLLIEPGIKLPGDYADNLDAIIDEIEKELGMELCTPDYEYSHGIIDNSVYYDGFNPWDNWSIGTKLPISFGVSYKFCFTSTYAAHRWVIHIVIK